MAIVLGAFAAITPLSIDTYLPALPSIADKFHATDSAVQITVTATLLGVAVGQLLNGPLADRFGRRRPLIAGMLLHLIASVLCAAAPTVELLTVARLLQGVGASAGAVIAIAVVRDLFVGLPAARLMARLTLVSGAAPILAPTLGSLLLKATDYSGLFVVLGVFGGALAAVAAFLLPETLHPVHRSSGGVGTAFRTYGRLLKHRQFVGLVLVSGLAMTMIIGYVSGASFVMQDQFGLTTSQFGLVFGINSVGLIAMTQVNPMLLRRYAPGVVLGGALAVATVSSALVVAAAVTGFGGLIGILVPLFVTITMAGLAMPNIPGLALAPHGHVAGTAAAVLGAVQFGASALLAPLVGITGAVTATSMAAVIFGAAALGLVALLVVVRPRRSDHQVDPDAEPVVALH
jgi:MFS transporter, DHA1 family, multidrug resistance protein